MIGPVEAPEAFFFIRVIGIEPARLIPFDKANREVRDALFQARAAEKRKEYSEQIRKNAVIRYYFD